MVSIGGVFSWGLAATAIVGSAYQIAAALLLRRFVAAPSPAPLDWPPVTLLKPLCGAEPDLEANLRSFCQQAYPRFQIVFGVHTADDSALPVTRKLQDEFSALDIQVVVGNGRPVGGNPKVANLIDMMPAAAHDLLVLCDSDIRVTSDYLANVVAALSRPGVGVATCLYVGRADGGLWSRIGAMGINHGFLPSVMVAQAIGRDDGCFGATIALRRNTLEKIGGFESLREQLADDYLLGAAVRATGQTIGLATALPQSVVHEPDLATMFAHEIRWGRTLASVDAAGYVASVVTLAVPVALLAVGIGGGDWPALGALALALAGRVWAVRDEESSLKLENQPIWLVLTRDVLSFAVQAIALSGRTVHWRGRRFRIARQGKLIPVGESRQP